MGTVLLTGAGGGGSNNLMRAMRHCAQAHALVGTNHDRFALARSLADENFRIPHSREVEDYLVALGRVIDARNVDLIVPTNDTEVGVLSAHRDRLDVSHLLPSQRAVEICQDKARFGDWMQSEGLPVPASRAVAHPDELPTLFGAFGRPERLWLRMRQGTGSRGSLPVSTADQASSWIRYWHEAREVPLDAFVLCEFLPGRDFAWQSLWKDGELVVAKTCERLEYIFGHATPAGTLSTPSIGKLVREDAVDEACRRTIERLEPTANGVFSIDLKQDAHGRPAVTEINIGRFFRISPIFNSSGKHNLAELYLDLAFGRPLAVPAEERYGDGGTEVYWLCDIDGEPSVLTGAEIDACSSAVP